MIIKFEHTIMIMILCVFYFVALDSNLCADENKNVKEEDVQLRQIETWIQALSCDDANITKPVQDKLISVDKKFLPVLVKALGDKNENIRDNMAAVLSEICTKEDVGFLINELKTNANEHVKGDIISLLGKIGDASAIPCLMETIKNGQRKHVVASIFALCRLGQPARPFILDLLNDKSRLIRACVIEKIGKTKDSAFIPHLIKVLKSDDDVSVISSARIALRDISKRKFNTADEWQVWWDTYKDRLLKGETEPFTDRQTIEEWAGQLKSSDFELQQEANIALKKIGKRAIPQVLPLLKNESPLVQEEAASVLAKIGDNAVKQELLNAMSKGNDDLCNCIAELLGEMKDDIVVLGLIKMLEEDKTAHVRAYAARSLGRIADKRAIPALLKALNDEDSYVFKKASYALGLFKSKEAVPLLIEKLKSKERYIAIYAADALHKLSGKDFGTDAAKWREWWEANKERILKEEAEKE